ncbi:MAG: LamG-like jellyroll fold domain-containing protein [Pseudomonadota bacterium]
MTFAIGAAVEGPDTNGNTPLAALTGPLDLSNQSHLDIPHDPNLAISQGTIALSFTPDRVDGIQALFSKDSKGRDNGEITAWIQDGYLKISYQSELGTNYIVVRDVLIEDDTPNHLAVSFGPAGLEIYLNGQEVASDPGYTRGLNENTDSLLLGASGFGRLHETSAPRDFFEGEITGFAVYDTVQTAIEIANLADAAGASHGTGVSDPITEEPEEPETEEPADHGAGEPEDPGTGQPAGPGPDPVNATGTVIADGSGPVFELAGDMVFDGDGGTQPDYVETDNFEGLLADPDNATLVFNFNAESLVGNQTLLSSDPNGGFTGQEGNFTALLIDGQLRFRIETDVNHRFTLTDLPIETGTDYQVAIVTGDDGLSFYVNGILQRIEPEFDDVAMQSNGELVVGAWTDTNGGYDNFFNGTVSDIQFYETALEPSEIVSLAVSAGLGHAAMHAAMMEDLLPAFAQAHHGSDKLAEMAADFGIHAHHGHIMDPVNMIQGTDGDDDPLDGTTGSDAINGRFGDDTINGLAGNDYLQGGYGNDLLNGGTGRDVLDGGHGEDRLTGGDGDDLLISRSDAREPYVFYDPNRDEGDPDGELVSAAGDAFDDDPENAKLYPDQPIPADDILTGGDGADTFYFQTLINGKEEFLLKHTNDDGTIHWHGVAGENDEVHDHWVDGIGDDVITDYDREEGDKIVIEGHTTYDLNITHHDTNGDGQMDKSVIELFSDQGANGGAHNHDRLGTITVFGDEVQHDDIIQTAAPAYGIVKSITDLEEAIGLPAESVDAIDPAAEAPTIAASTFGVINGKTPTFALEGDFTFDRDVENFRRYEHTDAMGSDETSIAVTFSVNELRTDGVQTIFSKDATGFNEGDVVLRITGDGLLQARVEGSQFNEKYILTATDFPITEGETYHAVVSMGGADGIELFLNGTSVAVEQGPTFGTSANTEEFLIGASTVSGAPAFDAHETFDGVISDVVMYGERLDSAEVSSLAQAAVGGVLEIPDPFVVQDGDNGTGGTDDTADNPVLEIETQDIAGHRGSEFDFQHITQLELEEGTIAFDFNADRISGRDTLFSKDASGINDGDITASINNQGKLQVVFENGIETRTVISEADVVTAGVNSEFVLSFDDDSIFVSLNDVEVGSVDNSGFGWDLAENQETLKLGASNANLESGSEAIGRQTLDGTIFNFQVFSEGDALV